MMMNKWSKSMLLSSFVFVAACVTINVYFPAAEVESAAKEFVEDVLREDSDTPTDDQSSVFDEVSVHSIAAAINPINWFIGTAHAQADITLSSPAITALKNKMIERMSQSLRSHLDSNVIGFTNTGLVEVIDASQLGLKDRQALKKVVADENRDREALYREVAIANNHPEWEEQIRAAFVKQWIGQAKSGWSYQNASGQWVKK
ncbi:YdbL family probable chaperone protein [Marinicella marina]|uniref:YdbL family protein n=2 Tax=Marinicella marina TaxID=2996016 RepID=UPI002260F68F|nr:YdbL family protein [Marinicella marina]MDJ1141160.1 YdbL family protein [Marinicella marina]